MHYSSSPATLVAKDKISSPEPSYTYIWYPCPNYPLEPIFGAIFTDWNTSTDHATPTPLGGGLTLVKNLS